MTWDWVAETGTRTARKRYYCDATEHLEIIVDGYADKPVTDEDIAAAKRLKETCHIEPGEQYSFVRGVWDGEFGVYRARVDADKLCAKYGVYGDD